MEMKLTENMVAVVKVLARMEKGFACEVLKDASLKGKTFNSVNATLAAAATKGLCAKDKAMFGEGDNAKVLTRYTITALGKEIASAPAE